MELTDEEIEAALTEATSATEPDSLRLLTDDRYNRALRERKVGGPTPSAGTAAASAKTEYDADPIRFRHGKKTLGAFRGILQRDHSLNKPVAVQSTALEVNTLRELADEVHT